MDSVTLVALGLGLVLLGGLAALAFVTRPGAGSAAFRWLGTGGCLLALAPALWWIGAGAAGGPSGPWSPVDPLSAWFLMIVLGIGAVTLAYGTRYLGGERSPRVAVAHALFAVLIIALAGVVTATTILGFLVAWEVMAVSGFLLIVFDDTEADVRRAGIIYLVLTHVSTLALLAMFAAWSEGDLGLRFADLSSSPEPRSLILLLAGLGFGIKAGAVPFHFWLPGAHAAAPSHVSALLSGVMIKMGIYGMLRVLILLGPPPAWWGWSVLVVGLGSAILGVLWALSQHDLKRLLAYHSIENIGIILLGLGLGALGAAYRQPAVALFGYAGALLHTLNHAVFKSLLFLGAGAVARATGTRQIDRLGGLAPALPRTGLAFALGSIAIVGLPPLNGFVGEWVIFQGLVQSGGTAGPLRVAAIGAAGLALTGGLALACFAKLFGTVFLGRRRTAGSALELEADSLLATPQVVLAAACVGLGLAAVGVVPVAGRAAMALVPGPGAAPELLALGGSALRVSLGAIAALGAGLLLWLAVGSARARRSVRSGPTWGCAFPAPTARMQYTSASFAAPLLGSFAPVVPSRVERGAGSFHVRPRDPVLDIIGAAVWRRVGAAAHRARLLQTGRIRWYVLYVILTLLALLVYLREGSLLR